MTYPNHPYPPHQVFVLCSTVLTPTFPTHPTIVYSVLHDLSQPSLSTPPPVCTLFYMTNPKLPYPSHHLFVLCSALFTPTFPTHPITCLYSLLHGLTTTIPTHPTTCLYSVLHDLPQTSLPAPPSICTLFYMTYPNHPYLPLFLYTYW